MNFNELLNIAKNDDISTPKDCAVVFSISFQPTKKNKELAFAYVSQNPTAKMIDHTPCGEKLEKLGNKISKEDLVKIWEIASTRYIQNASGNITAFVDNAHPQSVFYRIELPQILQNPKISTINGIDKHLYLKKP